MMVAVGTRTRFVETIRFLLVVWNLLNVHGASEVVEIVTPENAKAVATEVPLARNATQGPPAADSYLRAYEEARRLRRGPVKRNDGLRDASEGPEDAYDTVVRSSHVPDGRYPSLTQPDWARPPRPLPPPLPYGPPHPHYHVELPPTQPCHQIPYSSPSEGFLPKKLSLKLLLKIILKLVLFKMFVKFVAVLCLLLFIPLLKSKETAAESEGDERRQMRQLDMMSNYIWDSIEEKNVVFDEAEEMKDIKDIADEMEEDNYFAGPERAVKFLEFCVSTVNNAVSYLLGYLKKQRNENDDLSFFIWDKFYNMVQGA